MSTDLLRRGAPVLFRVLVASVFGYAGLEKFLAPGDFVEQIANYQWLPGWSS